MRAAAVTFAVLGLAAGCGGGGEQAAPVDGCESVDAPKARDSGESFDAAQPLDDGTTYTLTFETSCGSFTVTLDTTLAPNTAASLVQLARDGYYDDTLFHRVVPGFVVQGGDPTQTGAGGPGRSTVDVPPSDARYTKGVVAMAKAGPEPPGTAGSQFFVVTADDAGLPPEYAIVGEVTEGTESVERIDALGVGDGPPAQPVVIRAVSVNEG